MTSYMELLSSLHLGDEVAERDPLLQKAFVATEDYRQVIEDRCDLVTGVKGSGKSAIVITALEDTARSAASRRFLLPAQNMRVGAAIYESDTIPEQASSDEDLYRRLWTVHVIGLVGNFLVHRFETTANVSDLRGALDSVGLLLGHASGEPDEVWRLAVAAILRPGITDPQLNKLLRYLQQALNRLNTNVWVIFDRLDDVYGTRMELEKRLVRGLLQAHIHIANFGPDLKTKLFLRSDLLDRVTLDRGLRNLDKVKRLRLNINAWDLSRLFLARLLQCDEFAKIARIDSPKLLDRYDILKGMAALLPKRSPNTDITAPPQDAYGYLFQRTADGTGRYTPRTTLAYLRLAIHEQRRVCERHNVTEIPQGPILQTPALHRAWVQLSEDRLENYIYAEFPQLRAFIDRLDGGPAAYPDVEAIGRAIMGRAYTAADAGMIVDNLQYCGLLAKGQRRITIAKLYTPALRAKADRNRTPRTDLWRRP
jgi:hypothetical protein